ncbi:hypothetical protein BD289DRAFT_486341 [Coniella lustricola]|uniref:Uncharacterized protein n=1 Tax=Coniella lustricola TaxID=2025994 RepID=A0A2T2ZVG3_9PEZI|nr:hypothetical protein BD289DRAFT_486341 [Coniella lustricola]
MKYIRSVNLRLGPSRTHVVDEDSDIVPPSPSPSPSPPSPPPPPPADIVVILVVVELVPRDRVNQRYVLTGPPGPGSGSCPPREEECVATDAVLDKDNVDDLDEVNISGCLVRVRVRVLVFVCVTSAVTTETDTDKDVCVSLHVSVVVVLEIETETSTRDQVSVV